MCNTKCDFGSNPCLYNFSWSSRERAREPGTGNDEWMSTNCVEECKKFQESRQQRSWKHKKKMKFQRFLRFLIKLDERRINVSSHNVKFNAGKHCEEWEWIWIKTPHDHGNVVSYINKRQAWVKDELKSIPRDTLESTARCQQPEGEKIFETSLRFDTARRLNHYASNMAFAYTCSCCLSHSMLLGFIGIYRNFNIYIHNIG